MRKDFNSISFSTKSLLFLHTTWSFGFSFLYCLLKGSLGKDTTG